jgi:hypothetical protein
MPTTAGHSTIAVLNPSDSRLLRTAALKGNLGFPEPNPELLVVGVGVGVTSPLPRGGAMMVDTAGGGDPLVLVLVSLEFEVEFGWALGSW